ncbi:ATPase [bacterium]|nr:ATPase [bacterium]
MKDYKAYYTINASPEEVYLALTTPTTIYLWSGEEAEMSTEPGSEFSLWEGAITGKNLEFEPNKKIVQQWYFGEEAPSIVNINLHEDKQRTSLELRHSNIPTDDYEDIVEGWNVEYFGNLKEFFEE